MLRMLLILLAITFLSACATTRAPYPLPEENRVFLDEQNRLHYEGEFTEEHVAALFRLYEEAPQKPDVLVISSGGGDVHPGLDLGEWVFDKDLLVSIGPICASSCANYVVTGARRLQLQPDSILIWHGSSWQDDMNELYLAQNEHVIQWRNREVAFFERIGVDYRIATLGFLFYTGADYRAVRRKGPILGFDYAIEDMAAFGVDQVEVVGGEWNWRAYSDCCHVIRVSMDRLRNQR